MCAEVGLISTDGVYQAKASAHGTERAEYDGVGAEPAFRVCGFSCSINGDFEEALVLKVRSEEVFVRRHSLLVERCARRCSSRSPSSLPVMIVVDGWSEVCVEEISYVNASWPLLRFSMHSLPPSEPTRFRRHHRALR